MKNIILLSMLFVIPRLGSQTLTTVASFSGTNGRSPNALVQGKDGNLYGTTSYGGSGPCTLGGVTGCGTVFRLTTSGTLTSLHSFMLSDGDLPGGGFASTLAQGSDGSLYGVTQVGGTATACSGPSSACGTVFKVAASGAVSSIYSFQAGNDGGHPVTAPVFASDGNLYGVTPLPGIAYMMSTSGFETPTFHFSTDGHDPQGSLPTGGLVEVSNGLFFGTTMTGGATGQGIVFSMTPSGNVTELYNFTGGSDGTDSRFALVKGGDGNVYGTTMTGGMTNAACPLGCGTIFKVTPAGAFSTVHIFTGGADGAGAEQLVKGVDGNIYGLTFVGSTSVLFKLANGALTNLYKFSATLPAGLITQGSDGTFYGVVGGTGTAYPTAPSSALRCQGLLLRRQPSTLAAS